ncbi:MAG: hypothetical protein ACE5JD_01790 [Candidatus Methylomirabilia bacterium]
MHGIRIAVSTIVAALQKGEHRSGSGPIPKGPSMISGPLRPAQRRT